jgi:hypothetical protein
MPILIAIIAILLVIAFSLGGDWNAADESTLYLLIAAVVLLFLVLFFLPYLQEFSRSEASRARIRKFRKKGKAWALRSAAASVTLAFLAVWLLREEPKTTALAVEPAAVTPAKAEPAPASAASAAPAPVRVPVPKVAVASSVPAKQPAGPAPVPASPAAPSADGGVANFVAAWARIWSEGDVDKYLATYSPVFVPADGLTRKVWEAQRRQRVDKGRGIVVKVRDIRVESADANHAKVVFVQQYSARGVTDLSNKTLQLERQDGTWRITRETAVAIPKTE